MDFVLMAAHKSCMHNRELLEKDSRCGCFHCRKIYAPKEITKWCDGGKTALCPHCGIDAVLSENAGFPLTGEFLEQMHDRWFGIDG